MVAQAHTAPRIPHKAYVLDPKGATARQNGLIGGTPPRGTSFMATNKKPGKWRKRTIAVRGGQVRSAFQETCEPLIFTAGYAYEAAEEAEARFKGESPGFQYSRLANPTVSMFEERMALLEGGALGRATASGMAAGSAVFLGSLKTGDHVVSASALFGSCRYVLENVLPRFGISISFVEGSDLGAWKAA